MKDPNPSNITGKKVQQHTFQHSIRWDYVVMAVAVIYVASKLFGVLSSSSEEDDDLEDAAEIEIEEGGVLA